MKRKRLRRRLLCVLIKCYNTISLCLRSECTHTRIYIWCVLRPSNFSSFSCDMPAGPYTFIYISKYLISQIIKCARIFYMRVLNLASECAGLRYRHDHHREFYFRRRCVVGREFVRGRQHISKSARREFRRGCCGGVAGPRGEGCCCVFLCALASKQSEQSPRSPPPGSQLCQRFQCEQECCFSPPASTLCAAECRVSVLLEEGRQPAGRLFCELGS